MPDVASPSNVALDAGRPGRFADGADRRIGWVDFAKGLGIFLVVTGHTIGGLINSGILPDSAAYADVVRYIYAFHMPLFFFLAGLFVRHSAKRPLPLYLKDKLSVVVYPYFLWSAIEGLLQHFSGTSVYHSVSWIDLLDIVYIPIDQYWFLYVIFVMYILFWFVCRWAIPMPAVLAFAAICYAAEAGGADGSDWAVLHSLGWCLIYFALGAAVVQTSLPAYLAISTSARLLTVAIVGYGLVGVVPTVDNGLAPLLRFAAAVAGTCATVALAMLLQRPTTRSFVKTSFVKTWGVHSLEIYVAHTIASAGVRIAMQKGFGYRDPFAHIAIGILVGIYAPLLFSAACRKAGISYVFAAGRVRRRGKPSSVPVGVAP